MHSRGQKNTPGLGDVGDPLRRFVVGTKNACKIAGLRAALEEAGPEGRVLSLVGSVAVEGLAVPSGKAEVVCKSSRSE